MDFASRWVLMGLVGEMEKVHRPVALRRSTGFWFLKQVYFTGSQWARTALEISENKWEQARPLWRSPSRKTVQAIWRRDFFCHEFWVTPNPLFRLCRHEKTQFFQTGSTIRQKMCFAIEDMSRSWQHVCFCKEKERPCRHTDPLHPTFRCTFTESSCAFDISGETWIDDARVPSPSQKNFSAREMVVTW